MICIEENLWDVINVPFAMVLRTSSAFSLLSPILWCKIRPSRTWKNWNKISVNRLSALNKLMKSAIFTYINAHKVPYWHIATSAFIHYWSRQSNNTLQNMATEINTKYLYTLIYILLMCCCIEKNVDTVKNNRTMILSVYRPHIDQ